jgi:hypothetical protein
VKIARLVLAFAFLAALLAAFRATSAETARLASQESHLTDPAPMAALDTRALDVVTLGHRGLYDDFSYLWLVQMLANPDVKTADPNAVQRAVDLTARHEPPIHSLYMMACMVLGMDLKKPEACEPIMLHGMKAVPNLHLLPATVGFMTAFELHDPQKGALYYRIAASKPGAPAYMGDLAEKLANGQVKDANEAQSAFEALFEGEKGLGDFMLKKAAQAPAPPQIPLAAPTEAPPVPLAPSAEPTP